MARSIDDYRDHHLEVVEPAKKTRNTARSTARAFAAAVSALAITALVITTSKEALYNPDLSDSELTAGTIDLTDDDANQALFDLENMAPNRPSVECIRLQYDGTLLPAFLTMATNSRGGLAGYLQLEVEEGTGGQFRDCSSFVRKETVFQGTVDELTALAPLELGPFLNDGDDRSFRFTFEMADEQGAVGQAATVRFDWEVGLS